ncbi:hypothetical protein IAU60_003534 [Kwoniella sp. DSM 27419]
MRTLLTSSKDLGANRGSTPGPTPSPSPAKTHKAMMKDPSIPMSTILARFDLTRVLPRALIFDLLVHHSSDPQSIISLIPSVKTYLSSLRPDADIKWDLRFFRFLLPHLGQHHMLALLPCLTEMLLERVDTEWELRIAAGKVDDLALNVQKWVDPFISYLHHFGEPSDRRVVPARLTEASSQTLPVPVLHQVTRIVEYVLGRLATLPSSSDLASESQPHLTKHVLKRLFTRRYLSPELMKILLRHCSDYSLELTPDQWHQCATCALQAGDGKGARRLDRMREKAIEGLKRSQASDVLSSESRTNARQTTDQTDNPAQLSPEDTRRLQQIRKTAHTISEMIIARHGRSFDDLLDALEPHLQQFEVLTEEADDEKYSAFRPDKYSPHTLLRYAWSALVQRTSNDPRTNSEILMEMADTLPGPAFVGHTLTPVMQGLIKRGEPLKAWQIWLELIDRERNAKPSQRGLFIDRVTLGVASEACYLASSLDAAITLVDTWARRPSDPSFTSTDRLAHSVQLDTQNFNILLNQCRMVGSPSIAFRLWQAAIPRYGVYHDDISLNLLLDIARYGSGENDAEGSPVGDRDVFKERLRAMAAQFRFGRARSAWSRGGSDGDEEALAGVDSGPDPVSLALGPTGVLLDPSGGSTSGALSQELPWEAARRIFRQVVFGNWPHLRRCKSPLDVVGHGPLGSFTSFFGTHEPTSEPDTISSQDQPTRRARPSATPLPSTQAQYTHIIPTSSTFRNYIALLGFYNLHAEIPLVLAWMKELGIIPGWSTMCLALLHVCENEGPRRWVRGFGGPPSAPASAPGSGSGSASASDASPDNGDELTSEELARKGRGTGVGLARDEEVVRRWLEDWLGEGMEDNGKGGRRRIVPSEEDVASSRRWLAERRQRLTA